MYQLIMNTLEVGRSRAAPDAPRRRSTLEALRVLSDYSGNAPGVLCLLPDYSKSIPGVLQSTPTTPGLLQDSPRLLQDCSGSAPGLLTRQPGLN